MASADDSEQLHQIIARGGGWLFDAELDLPQRSAPLGGEGLGIAIRARTGEEPVFGPGHW